MKKAKTILSLVLALCMVLALAACGSKPAEPANPNPAPVTEKTDQELADEAAALIDAIYVQERTDKTDEQCAAAKAA